MRLQVFTQAWAEQWIDEINKSVFSSEFPVGV